MIGIGLRLAKKAFGILSDPLGAINNYFRPDGVSTYKRPDGVSNYIRP